MKLFNALLSVWLVHEVQAAIVADGNDLTTGDAEEFWLRFVGSDSSLSMPPTNPPAPVPTNPPGTPSPTLAPTPRPTNAPDTPRPTRAPKTPRPTRAPRTPRPTPLETPRPTNPPRTPRPTNPPETSRPTTSPVTAPTDVPQACFVEVAVDCVTAPSFGFPDGRPCDEITPPIQSCTDNGGPLDVVEFSYAAGTCDQSSNGQGGVFECQDSASFPVTTESVVIECTDSDMGDSLEVEPVVVSSGGIFSVTTSGGGSLPALISCSLTDQVGTLIQSVTFDVSGNLDLNLNDKFGGITLKSCDERDCLETLNYSYDLFNKGTDDMLVYSVNRTITDGITTDRMDLVNLVNPNPMAPGETVAVDDVFTIDVCVAGGYEVDVVVNASSPDAVACFAGGGYDFTVAAPFPVPTPVPSASPLILAPQVGPTLPPSPVATPRPSPVVTPRPTLAPTNPPVTTPTTLPPLTPTLPPTMDSTGVCELDFVVTCEIDGEDCTDLSPATDVCTDRPTEMTMLLNGGSCSQSYSVQIYTPDKFSCTDVAASGVPTTEGTQVYVVVTALNDASVVYTSQYVAVGDSFPINGNGQQLAADQNITIYSSDQIGPETMLQTVRYSSSCSQDLFLQDRFGAVQVLGWTNAAQGAVSVFATASFDVLVTVPSEIAGNSLTLTSFFAVTNFGVFNFTDDVFGQALLPGATVEVSFNVTLDLTQPRRYTVLAEITADTDTGVECQGSAFYNFSAGASLPPSMPSLAPAPGPSKGSKGGKGGKDKKDKGGKGDDKKGGKGDDKKDGKDKKGGKAGIKETPKKKGPPAAKSAAKQSTNKGAAKDPSGKAGAAKQPTDKAGGAAKQPTDESDFGKRAVRRH